MKFDEWLNKADEEIKERKKKDLIKFKGLKKDYDNWIHQLYIAYQTNKNSRLLFLATLGLLGVTAIYALLIFQSNQLISSQFEIENKPYINIINLSKSGADYKIKIINLGETPAKINDAILSWMINESATKEIHPIIGTGFKIFPNEEKEIQFYDKENILTPNKESPIMITTIFYESKEMGRRNDSLTKYYFYYDKKFVEIG